MAVQWTLGGTNLSSTTGSGTWSTNFVPPPVSNDPVLRGLGPAECSSSTELSVQPVNIWDVNGYYRELGVRPTASRRELRLAYQAKRGQHNARLTYCFKQLLNDETRRRYDLTPLGELFIDDYVREMLNRLAKARMSERMANLAAAGVHMDSIDEDGLERDVYAEMGFEVKDADTPSEMVDPASNMGKDDDRPAKFEYSYYLWKTRLRDDYWVADLLSKWQQMLVTALAREGVRIRFAVGLHGDPHRWIEATVGYRTVFFLNVATAPTQDLADDVARQVCRDRGLRTSLAITER